MEQQQFSPSQYNMPEQQTKYVTQTTTFGHQATAYTNHYPHIPTAPEPTGPVTISSNTNDFDYTKYLENYVGHNTGHCDDSFIPNTSVLINSTQPLHLYSPRFLTFPQLLQRDLNGNIIVQNIQQPPTMSFSQPTIGIKQEQQTCPDPPCTGSLCLHCTVTININHSPLSNSVDDTRVSSDNHQPNTNYNQQPNDQYCSPTFSYNPNYNNSSSAPVSQMSNTFPHTNNYGHHQHSNSRPSQPHYNQYPQYPSSHNNRDNQTRLPRKSSRLDKRVILANSGVRSYTKDDDDSRLDKRAIFANSGVLSYKEHNDSDYDSNENNDSDDDSNKSDSDDDSSESDSDDDCNENDDSSDVSNEDDYDSNEDDDSFDVSNEDDDNTDDSNEHLESLYSSAGFPYRC